jgi:hypothetical protein
MSDPIPEPRGDARPIVFGSHKDAEWNAVQGKVGPITLWRWQDGHGEHFFLSRASAEELWRELAGFLGHVMEG